MLGNSTKSQDVIKFLSEFRNQIQIEKDLKIYGLTQNTDEYMFILDEFSSKRNPKNGTCLNCKTWNTSRCWCQACDPLNMAQGWTSGNKNIDECIKEFQLKAIKYENVIE